MATVMERPPRPQGYLQLDDISWQLYDILQDGLGERHLRITFDRGKLEIMTLSPEHERIKHSLRRLVEILLEELDLPEACFGSMTFREEELEKGLQPDECYWIQNEEAVRDMDEFDPKIHPPPDLVLEVDITSSSIDRLSIYETFGVVEVWRWHDNHLEFRILDKSGKLKIRKTSVNFAGVKTADILPFLKKARTDGQASMLKSFRQWVRERISTGVLKGKKSN